MSFSYNHSAILVNICTEINNTRKFRAFINLSLMIEHNECQPDIAIYEWRDILEEDVSRISDMPLTVVEFLIPSRSTNELLGMSKLYLRSDIQSVWIVEPFMRTIAVCSEEGVKRYAGHDTIEDERDISIELEKIFR